MIEAGEITIVPNTTLSIDRYSKKIDIVKLKEDIEDIADLFKIKKLGPENISQLVIEVVTLIQSYKKKLTQENMTALATQILNYLIEEIIPGEGVMEETILKALVPDLVERLMNLDIRKMASKCLPCI